MAKLNARGVLRGLLVAAAPLCIVAQSAAAGAAWPPPEARVSLSTIGSPFGERGAPAKLYEGENVEVTLILINSRQEPVSVGASLQESAWVPGLTFALERVTPTGKEAGRSHFQLVFYQGVVKEVKERAPGTLYPGEYIKTAWRVTVDGAPLPPGGYLVRVVGEAPPLFIPPLPLPVFVVTANGRLDELNRMCHLGVRLGWAKRFDDSLAMFQRILALVPGSPTAYAGMGAVHQDAGDYEQAIAMYQRAIAILESGELPPEQPRDRMRREHQIGGLRGMITACRRQMARQP
ncbi:MAG: tetratricopeptide repeat protein [Armatimonadetes bacterium]|nr:tetratricopeptide repeat protein [Armatimonadota bacterium]